MSRTYETNIAWYDTYYQLSNDDNPSSRIIGLSRTNTTTKFKLRPDLMSVNTSTIWIEARMNAQTKFLICEFYQEWTHRGDGSIERAEDFAEQIQRAHDECARVVIVGDANLCNESWNDKN